MRWVLQYLAMAIACMIMVHAGPAAAQNDTIPRLFSEPGDLIIPPPMIEPASPDGSRCFTILNKAPYTVMGSIRTGFVDAADGTRVRKSANFRLGPGARQQACTKGPYHKGGRVELILRTIVPIFSCYVVPQGEVVIHGEIKKSGSRTWADCNQ